MKEVLVTGGAGYIGSHMCVELLNAGYQVTVLDNLINSSRRSLDAVENITGRRLHFVHADLRDKATLRQCLPERDFDAVLHFAGLKAVAESVCAPVHYYANNVEGTLNLLEVLSDNSVRKLVFSSSATVYGLPDAMPIDEQAAIAPINPYGRSKRMVEQILEDLQHADHTWRISALRYFNPVGAHPSGHIGEDPRNTPNNLMPFIAQVAVGRREQLRVFGNDYPTADGTGVRDYIHVMDLARGHLDALRFLEEHEGYHVHNLGTGIGYSVLEVVEAFERASGRRIPYTITERRPGDAAVSYADPARARSALGFEARFDLDKMCEDTWRWQMQHPEGYDSAP